ncbi:MULTISPECIES: NirD/YgiW/YdeI family stress tolerance protein [unclassified Microcoleus]|uniref:NirD/YgiW/YdeI family stress tolerance protein n=1 Tax=unclassified Microcoleus TaxID=2642155 RepID=UPI002FD5C6A0
MKQKVFFSLATITALAVLINPVLVQAQNRIGELRSSNKGTTISGTVFSVVGNDFILDDGTGQVIVDAGPRWWRQVNLTKNERVTVVGEMDEGEFDAFSIKRADGTTIEIRSPEGPPPWAGKRDR